MNDILRVIVYGGLFAVPFLTMFVVNDYFFPFITGKNFAFRIIVEVVFVAWVLLMLVEAKYRLKFSWLIASFASLLVVMFFANLLGEHPHTGFWSNFERMDGYITLVHVFLYAVVLGSVLSTKRQWGAYLHTTLGVAFLVALYGLGQYSGSIAGYTGRIESFLGNAAYFAIYMYFHIFIAFWLFVENRSPLLRTVYALCAALFTFTLLESGTRGTAIGLVVGAITMVGYVALLGARYPEYRRYAVGIFTFLLIGAGGFYLARDTATIQSSPSLARIANIDLKSDLVVRGTIWGMAWEGVKERPLLGWGQGNFNYIFNEKYDPFLYNQEQWFDRVHDIFLDWLVAGGFLGLIAYLGIFAACVYYLLIVPLRTKDEQTFTTLERGVLLGILAGYMTHNLVVFDNIVSYIFFAVILGLIHSRVGEPMKFWEGIKIDRAIFAQFIVPAGAVLVVALVYTLHVPGMQAAGDIIDAYRATTPSDKLAGFERALSRNSFAHQEITEQISQMASSMARDTSIPEDIRKQFVLRSEEELNKLVAEKPGDARVHVFFSSFYRSVGDLASAERQIVIAEELSPRKPSIIMQHAIIKYSQNDLAGARDLFKKAYELDERNDEARLFYAGTLFLTGEGEAGKALVTDDRVKGLFAQNDFLISAVNSAGDTAFLKDLYQVRIAADPATAQNWASLAFIYYQDKDTKGAIETLRKASEAVPTFAKSAQCFIANIEAGKEPQTGCQ